MLLFLRLLPIYCLFCLNLFAQAQTASPNGIPPTLKKLTLAPVIVDSVSIAQTWVLQDLNSKQFFFESKPIVQGLQSTLVTEKILQLSQMELASGLLSADDFAKLELDIRFDEAKVEIYLEVPVRFRNMQKFAVKKSPLTGAVIQASSQSGYFNLRALSLQTKSAKTASTTNQADGQLIHNFDGLVFESNYFYNSSLANKPLRRDTRFILDHESGRRLTVGDLDFLPHAYIPGSHGAGVSYNYRRNNSNRTLSRMLSQTILQNERPATLEIYVNDHLVNSFRVQPGPVDLHSIPLTSGENNLRFVVKDDLGRQEEHKLFKFMRTSGLGAGESEWELALVKPIGSNSVEQIYEVDNSLSALWRRGYSDQLSLGLGGMNLKSNSLFNGDLDYSHKYFDLNLQLAKAETPGFNSVSESGAMKLSWTAQNNQGPRWFFSSEGRGRWFLTPQSFFVLTNQLKQRSELAVAQNINWRSYAQIGLEKVFTYDLLGPRDILKAQWSLRFSPQSRLDFNWQISQQDQQKEWETFVTWTLFESRFYSQLSLDQRSQTKSLQVNLAPQSITHGYSLNADASTNEIQKSFNLGGEYYTRFGSLRSSYGQFNDGELNSERADLALNSALAWSGGYFAVTRPVSDSFALIKVEDLEGENQVLVNSNAAVGAAQARIGKKQNIVLPDLASYLATELQFDGSELPPGHKLKDEFFLLKPRFKSGVLVVNQLQKYANVRGYLKDENGQSIKYTIGKILNANGQVVNEDFFTNAKGYFVLENLTAGAYFLHLQDGSKIEFKLEPDKSTILDLQKPSPRKDSK